MADRAHLAPRELAVLRALATGATPKAIARDLSISLETVRWYCKRIYRALGVQGRAEAVATATARGLVEAPAPPPRVMQTESLPFSGRHDELAWLLDTVSVRPATGGPSIRLIEGISGSGKTRLLDEFQSATRARWPHIPCLRSGCVNSGTPLPHHVVLAALRDWCEETDTSLTPLVPQPLRSSVHDLLPEVTATGDSRPLNPEIARTNAYEGIAVATRGIAGDGPLLFLVDDVHWIDQQSSDLLSHLVTRWAAAGTDVVLVVSRRTLPESAGQFRSSRLGEIVRAPGSEQRTLGPLTESDICTILESLSDAEESTDAADSVARDLHRRTGGSPLYLAALVGSLRSGAAGAPGLDLASMLSDLETLSTLDVPGPLRGVILDLVGRLADMPRNVLLRLCILGRPATPALIAAMCELRSEDVAQALDILEDHNLARLERAGRFDVAHDVIRVAVLDEIGASIRALGHAAIASALERSAADPAEIAAHADAAGLDDVAFAAALAATEAAEAAYSPDAAASMATIAWARRDAASSSSDLVRLYTIVGSVRTMGADYEGALALYEQAADEAMRRADGTLALVAAIGRARLRVMPGPLIDPRKAKADLETALELADRLGDRAAAGQARQLLVRSAIASFNGYRDAEREARRLIESVEPGDPADIVPDVRMSLARVVLRSGSTVEASRLADEAADAWKRLGHDAGRAEALQVAAMSRALRGELSESLSTAAMAERCAERGGSMAWWPAIVAENARTHWLAGATNHALAELERARSLGATMNMPNAATTLLDYWQAVILVDSGDIDEASPILEALLNFDTADPFIAAFPLHPVVRLCAAIVAARRGERTAAQQAFGAGAAGLQHLLEQLDTTWFEAAVVLGGAAVATGRLDVAEATAHTMRRLADARSIGVFRPEGLWLQRMVHLANDRHDDATVLLEAADDAASAIGTTRPPGGALHDWESP